MEDNLIRENTKDVKSNKDANLDLIAAALQNQLITDFIDKTALYDKKFDEIFNDLNETQELLLLSIDESKKTSLNLSQIEIDARISKALQEFGFSNDGTETKKSGGFLIYIFVAIIFLTIGYFIK